MFSVSKNFSSVLITSEVKQLQPIYNVNSTILLILNIIKTFLALDYFHNKNQSIQTSHIPNSNLKNVQLESILIPPLLSNQTISQTSPLLKFQSKKAPQFQPPNPRSSPSMQPSQPRLQVKSQPNKIK